MCREGKPSLKNSFGTPSTSVVDKSAQQKYKVSPQKSWHAYHDVDGVVADPKPGFMRGRVELMEAEAAESREFEKRMLFM